MSNIYEYAGGYYKMVKPAGTGRFKGYALWRPVRKVFGFLWVRRYGKGDFWLDTEGFVKI